MIGVIVTVVGVIIALGIGVRIDRASARRLVRQEHWAIGIDAIAKVISRSLVNGGYATNGVRPIVPGPIAECNPGGAVSPPVGK